MIWTAYHVALRVRSPLHLGWRTVGNLQQTRPYVSGRVLWGALTARLARTLHQTPTPAQYAEIGAVLDAHIAFTYLFPSVEPCRVAQWPWRDGWPLFAATYLGSYASSALDLNQAALDGSLHETEFISPWTRGGAAVYLVGYLFVHRNCTYPWQQALASPLLTLGGERGYGWGRVAPTGQTGAAVSGGAKLSAWPRPGNDNQSSGALAFDGTAVRPILTAQGEVEVPAHIRCENAQFGGEVELLLGRETTERGHGEHRSDVEVCWAPGTRCRDARFAISSKGLWRYLDKDSTALSEQDVGVIAATARAASGAPQQPASVRQHDKRGKSAKHGGKKRR